MVEQREAHWGPKLWEDLRKQDPEIVCKRCAVAYDDTGVYKIESLGTSFQVYPGEERVESPDSFLAESLDFQLVLVSYLLSGQNIEPEGRWVSEKDLDGGSTFFRGPHALPSAPLENQFGSDLEGFLTKAASLAGSRVEFGDAAMAFPALPRVSLVIVLWAKDEEFPARVTFMVDSTIDKHLPLDVIAAMTIAITQRLLHE